MTLFTTQHPNQQSWLCHSSAAISSPTAGLKKRCNAREFVSGWCSSSAVLPQLPVPWYNPGAYSPNVDARTLSQSSERSPSRPLCLPLRSLSLVNGMWPTAPARAATSFSQEAVVLGKITLCFPFLLASFAASRQSARLQRVSTYPDNSKSFYTLLVAV